MNFLEQLAAEWYQYSGWFVRTNVRWGKREKGGYDGELDVLAFDPSSGELVHIETSGDSDSWPERRERFLRRKFALDPGEYLKMVKGEIRTVRRVAVVGQTRSTNADLNWGPGIEVKLIAEFMAEVVSGLPLNAMSQAVPEGYPLLRAIQMVVHYCGKSAGITGSGAKTRPSHNGASPT
jgi:hypothetical protein